MTRSEVYRANVRQLLLNTKSILINIWNGLPLAVFCGVVTLLIVLFVCRLKNQKKPERKKLIGWIGLAFYSALLVELVIVSRPIGSVKEPIDFIPFNMPGGINLIILYAVANAVAFVPLGIFCAMSIEKMKTVSLCIILGFLISFCIEGIQYFLCCGVAQTEDVLMNTIGSGLGYWGMKKIMERKR
jgi:glycopeptide antibiotics resistance protein